MHVGHMVRAEGGGPLMKILSKWNGQAHCAWVDQRGNIHYRDFEMDQLLPFWLATGPRTTWPEITDMPDEPNGPKLISVKKGRGSSKKPRASNRIRRRRNAA